MFYFSCFCSSATFSASEPLSNFKLEISSARVQFRSSSLNVLVEAYITGFNLRSSAD